MPLCVGLITQADIFQTLGPDYTFPKGFGALNTNPTSELFHHVRFSRNPNLTVQKILFFCIFKVKLHSELIFFLKSDEEIMRFYVSWVAKSISNLRIALSPQDFKYRISSIK